jgi:hypothetical protein
MKMYFNMLVATFVAILTSSCMYNNQSTGGGGGTRIVRHDSPKVKSASAVFGNQPMNPTRDAVQSTWGATMSSEYWYNDARRGDRALLQRTSPNEPVLVSRSAGWVWRAGCFNRVVPAEPYTEETVAVPSSGGGTIYGPSYKLDINMPITIIGGEGGGYGGYERHEYYQTREYYQPQREYRQPRYQRPSNDCGPNEYRPDRSQDRR